MSQFPLLNVGALEAPNGNHYPMAAKVFSRVERGRPATSVHGFFLAVFRARAQRSDARARSIGQLYHSILVNALLGRKFGKGLANGNKERNHSRP